MSIILLFTIAALDADSDCRCYVRLE